MESWKLLSRRCQYLFPPTSCPVMGIVKVFLVTGPRLSVGVILLSYELQLPKVEKFCARWLLKILVVCRIRANKNLTVS